MLSSLNAFSGLSAANISMLFGANSSPSSSSATSANAAQSASPSVSASGANDPAAAIKAILAAAQLESSSGGWTSMVSVVAAYAAQTDDSNSVTGSSVAVSTPSGAAGTDNYGIESGSSLVVGTASGVVGVTMTDDTQAATWLSSTALDTYQFLSTQAQQAQAQSVAPASTTGAPSAPTSVGINDSVGYPQIGQSVLQLTISVMNPDSAPPSSGSAFNALVEAQAQQFVTSFENNTLSPTSSNATGFSFIETDGASTTISITGIEISNFGSAPVPGSLTVGAGTTVQSFLASVNGSGYDFAAGSSNSGITLIVPLGGS